MSERARVLCAVYLTSFAVLTLELSLTRLFSATMYYHFAFLAISVAMFGAGASGVFVFLAGPRLEKVDSPRLLGGLATLFALSVVAALLAVLANPLARSTAGEPVFRSLLWIYLAIALPFFLGGAVITVAIRRSDDVGKLYLCDLAGAATGCLALIPLLDRVGAVDTVLAAAVVGAVAALVVRRGRVTVATTAVLAALLVSNVVSHRIAVRWAKGHETADVLFSRWNSFSHVTVEGRLTDPKLRVLIDADAETDIRRDAAHWRPPADVPPPIEGLAYLVSPPGKVLIIGPGGGPDVVIARAFGQRRITAVEVNRLIAVDVMRREPFRSYSGDLYGQQDVRLVVDEGRSFIRSSRDRYDVILASMVDTWAATAAGAFALAENNLYTVEAFEDYIRHLEPDGKLSLTRWYTTPPDQVMRLVTVTRQAMGELGIGDPAQHFVVVLDGDPRVRAWATFLFKKSAFTSEEVRTLESAVARSPRMRVLYSPLTRPDSPLTWLITAPDPASVWRSASIDLSPTRDDAPFFFYTLKLSRLSEARWDNGEWGKTNLGAYMLFSLFAISIVMVTCFLVLPLAVARGRSLARTAGGSAYLVYFGAIGFSFMLVEVAMIQRFMLFLGHPVYALVVVLFSLLAFCGVGSFLTRRFDDAALPRTLAFVVLAVVVLVGVYIVALPPLFYHWVQLARASRVAISVALLIPLATVMGMPMPIGLRLAARRAPEIVPWAWGINGATSVLGSVSALVLALLTGFGRVLALGAVFYVVALLAMRRVTVASDSASAGTPAWDPAGAPASP